MHIVVLCLTDDPFDPPGYGRHGGSHKVMFDMGRQFVRRGARVTFVTRTNSPSKARFQEFGALCRIHRIAVGPAEPIPYFRCAAYLDEMTSGIREIADVALGVVDRIVSYNWLSGETAVRIYGGSAMEHIHIVLALGRAKLASGEPKEKVSDLWLNCEDRIFAQAHRIVTCSTQERRDVLSYYANVDPAKVFCIPLGVDLDVFDRRPRAPDHLVRRAADRFGKGFGDAG